MIKRISFLFNLSFLIISGCNIKPSITKINIGKQENVESCLKIYDDDDLREQSRKYLGTCLELGEYVTNSGLKFIKYYKNLTKLKILNWNIDNKGLSQLSSTTKLKEIFLSSYVSVDGLKYLFGNKGLRKIISNFNIENDQDKIFLRFKKLEWLSNKNDDINYKTKLSLLRLPRFTRLGNPVNLTDDIVEILGNKKNMEQISIVISNKTPNWKIDKILKNKHYKWVSIKGSALKEELINSIVNISELNNLSFDYEGNCNSLFKLKKLPNLKYLKIRSKTCDNDFLLKLYSSLPGIVKISVNLVTNKGLNSISDSSNIEELHISLSNKVTKKGLYYIKKFKKLRKLEIGTISADTDLEFIKDLKNLKILDVSGLERVTGKFPVNDKLTYLNFDNSYICDDGLKAISNISTLKTLLFSYNNDSSKKICITDKGAFYLSKLINLEKITIFVPNTISDKGIGYLKTLRKLKEFKLSLNRGELTGSGFRYWGEQHNLRKLSIVFSKLDCSIIESISGFKNLKRLDFWNTDLQGHCEIIRRLKYYGIYIDYFHSCIDFIE